MTGIHLISALGVLVPLSNSLSPGSPKAAARSYPSYMLAGQCGAVGVRGWTACFPSASSRRPGLSSLLQPKCWAAGEPATRPGVIVMQSSLGPSHQCPVPLLRLFATAPSFPSTAKGWAHRLQM